MEDGEGGYRDFPLRVSRISARDGRYSVGVIGWVPGNEPPSRKREWVRYAPERWAGLLRAG